MNNDIFGRFHAKRAGIQPMVVDMGSDQLLVFFTDFQMASQMEAWTYKDFTTDQVLATNSNMSAEDGSGLLTGERGLFYIHIGPNGPMSPIRVVGFQVASGGENKLQPFKEVYSPTINYDKASNTLNLFYWTNIKFRHKDSSFTSDGSWTGVYPPKDSDSSDIIGDSSIVIPNANEEKTWETSRRVLCHARGMVRKVKYTGGNVDIFEQFTDLGYKKDEGNLHSSNSGLVPWFYMPRILTNVSKFEDVEHVGQVGDVVDSLELYSIKLFPSPLIEKINGTVKSQLGIIVEQEVKESEETGDTGDSSDDTDPILYNVTVKKVVAPGDIVLGTITVNAKSQIYIKESIFFTVPSPISRWSPVMEDPDGDKKGQSGETSSTGGGKKDDYFPVYFSKDIGIKRPEDESEILLLNKQDALGDTATCLLVDFTPTPSTKWVVCLTPLTGDDGESGDTGDTGESEEEEDAVWLYAPKTATMVMAYDNSIGMAKSSGSSGSSGSHPGDATTGESKKDDDSDYIKVELKEKSKVFVSPVYVDNAIKWIASTEGLSRHSVCVFDKNSSPLNAKHTYDDIVKFEAPFGLWDVIPCADEDGVPSKTDVVVWVTDTAVLGTSEYPIPSQGVTIGWNKVSTSGAVNVVIEGHEEEDSNGGKRIIPDKWFFEGAVGNSTEEENSSNKDEDEEDDSSKSVTKISVCGMMGDAWISYLKGTITYVGDVVGESGATCCSCCSEESGGGAGEESGESEAETEGGKHPGDLPGGPDHTEVVGGEQEHPGDLPGGPDHPNPSPPCTPATNLGQHP